MINAQVSEAKKIRGRTIAESRRGAVGHAVFGPYVTLQPGTYAVEFCVSPVDLDGCEDDDVCATIDVAADHGRLQVASGTITAGLLRAGRRLFHLSFELARPAVIEYRVGVHGNAAIAADDYRPLLKLTNTERPDFDARRFPHVTSSSPQFLQEQEERLRNFYEIGFLVQIDDDRVVMTKDGIRFYADCLDDLNLIHEIFIEEVYRFGTHCQIAVIDVGMNLGLVAMQFSLNPAVRSVHAFEPFPSTFERAQANLRLNPELATKIEPINAGLGVRSGTMTFNVTTNSDTGSQATRDDENGDTEVELNMMNAADAVRAIIDRADQEDLKVVMKIDCEGAEFEILAELDQSGLLPRISALMVEWHRIFPGKTQADLIEPLKKAGFIIFDRSPPMGNGFFYAVRH